MNPNWNGVEICVQKGNAELCLVLGGQGAEGLLGKVELLLCTCCGQFLEFEGLLKHLKRKRTGSCRGVKEREGGRSEGLRGRRAEPRLQFTRDRGGVREGEVKGCVQQVAENMVRRKICNPDC